jgi:SAM-dependent methyltransferase
MIDAATIAVYDTRAEDYAHRTDDFNATDPQLTAFIGACRAGGHVLDLGCGPGMAAAVMARAGLTVDAVDASSEMVAMASRRPGVSARQATFDDVTGVDTYDGIWASFSLLHAPRTDLPRHLKALHTALKPGGAFFIGMKLGSGEGPDRIGRYYAYYSVPELESLLQRAGFTVLDHLTGSGAGLDGSVSDWVSVAAHG